MNIEMLQKTTAFISRIDKSLFALFFSIMCHPTDLKLKLSKTHNFLKLSAFLLANNIIFKMKKTTEFSSVNIDFKLINRI